MVITNSFQNQKSKGNLQNKSRANLSKNRGTCRIKCHGRVNVLIILDFREFLEFIHQTYHFQK